MIIAIDGPAASGKSTVARALARELGLAFLNTGALYRGLALAALRRGLPPSDAAGLERLAHSLRLDFDARGHLLVDGLDEEQAIRSRAVDAVVSEVSAHPGVRRAVVPLQRELGRRGPGVVAEGRDIATVVFPAADHKFFLTASAAERARRRARQEGAPEREAEIRREIEERDRRDSERADSPLVRAEDALLVSTDGMTVEEVVRTLVERVRGGARP